MILVVDASVVVKWVLPDPAEEGDRDKALAVLAAIGERRAHVLQPSHWLLEVAAVLARLRPEVADDCIDILDLMELPIAGDPALLKRAGRLAGELDHHLFDTLYHAVALEHAGILVTADGRYARKAKRLGHMVELREWSPADLPALSPT